MLSSLILFLFGDCSWRWTEELLDSESDKVGGDVEAARGRAGWDGEILRDGNLLYEA